MRKNPRLYAFSLVELSIVLVILGLLVGGILAGQSLIHAAELRKGTSSLQNYTTAVNAFRDKYFGLPGDLTNATSFWGKDATICNGSPGSAGTPGTCNGNGSGLIDIIGQSPNSRGESTNFWHQLTLAGLIEGGYNGLTNAAAPYISAGANMPVFMRAPIGIVPYSYGMSYNVFEIGVPQISSGNYVNTNAFHGHALTPEDTWNIDTKLDDGLPLNGKLTASGDGTHCVTGSQYNLNDYDVGCTVFYRF